MKVLGLTSFALLGSQSKATPMALGEETAVEPDAAALWPSQHYVTERFTAPDLNISQSGPIEPGYLFFSPARTGIAPSSVGGIIMTSDNQLIWSGRSRGWVLSQNLNVQQFQGKPVLTFWNGSSLGGQSHGYGAAWILDTGYNVLHKVCPKLNIVDDTGVPLECYVDQHESFITPRNTMLVSVYNSTPADLSSIGGPKNGWLLDSQFYEVNPVNNEVLFRWSSMEHIPLSKSHYPLNGTGTTRETAYDFFHINSIQSIDGGYLVNARHTWSFYKVGLKGKVIWTLEGSTGGDFALGPGITFRWQHDSRVIAKTSTGALIITLFNDGSSEADPRGEPATGLSLQVDVAKRTATLLRDLQDPAETLFVLSQGSYQALSKGAVLVGYGSVPQIKEFTSSGAVAYTAQFGQNEAVASYRAYKHPWVATPSSLPPKLVIRCVPMGSQRRDVLFMSWNGATTYTAWSIMAGAQPSTVKEVARVNRTGFETRFVAPMNRYSYVVQPLGPDGKPMSRVSAESQCLEQ